MGKTSIDYADESWQIVTGCSPVSAGCENCWAAKQAATRLKYQPAYEGLARRTERGRYQWTGEVRLHPEKLTEPLHWRRPKVIFVAPMGDLFHEAVPDRFVDRVFALMAVTPRHRYLVLTKRGERLTEYAAETPIATRKQLITRLAFEDLYDVPWPLPNIYLGASVEDQETADRRLPELVKLAAQGWHTWVSLEPQIGPVDFSYAFGCSCGNLGQPTLPRQDVVCSLHDLKNKPPIDWLVQGCESGPNARPFEMDWTRSIREQCQAAGVKYYLKQLEQEAWWGRGKLIHLPELDGRQWLETPW